MKISQREARRLKKRVQELEKEINAQRASWSSDWPGGVHIATAEADMLATICARLETARRLGHAVVATEASKTRIEFRALPLPA